MNRLAAIDDDTAMLNWYEYGAVTHVEAARLHTEFVDSCGALMDNPLRIVTCEEENRDVLFRHEVSKETSYRVRSLRADGDENNRARPR